MPSHEYSIDSFLAAIVQVFDVINFLILIVASIRWMQVSERSVAGHKLKDDDDAKAESINEAKTYTMKRPLKGLGKSVSLKSRGYSVKFVESKKPEVMVGNRKNTDDGVRLGEDEDANEAEDVVPGLLRKDSMTAEELKEVADEFIARMRRNFQIQRLDSLKARQLD